MYSKTILALIIHSLAIPVGKIHRLAGNVGAMENIYKTLKLCRHFTINQRVDSRFRYRHWASRELIKKTAQRVTSRPWGNAIKSHIRAVPKRSHDLYFNLSRNFKLIFLPSTLHHLSLRFMRHRCCTGHRGLSLEAREIGEWAPQWRWLRSVANQHVSAFESSWEALSTFTKLFTGSESSLTFFNTILVISLSQAAHIRFKQVICAYIRIGRLSPTWGFYQQHWPCSRTQSLEDTPRGRASPGSDRGENDQRKLSPCSKTHYDTGRTKSTVCLHWPLIRDLGMTLIGWSIDRDGDAQRLSEESSTVPKSG